MPLALCDLLLASQHAFALHAFRSLSVFENPQLVLVLLACDLFLVILGGSNNGSNSKITPKTLNDNKVFHLLPPLARFLPSPLLIHSLPCLPPSFLPSTYSLSFLSFCDSCSMHVLIFVAHFFQVLLGFCKGFVKVS